MRKHLTLGTLSLVASAFLIGCGSSSTDTITETQTGYFIDAPVAGLSYKTSSGFTGVTDSKGSFQYKKGESVAFAIGRLNLGEAEPTAEGLISPRELTDDEALVTLLLRTLQALDIDNDPSNGITIPASAITALENISADVEISDLLQDSDVLNISTNLSEFVDEDYDGEIDVNSTEAITHYEENLVNWDEGQRPEETVISNHGSGDGTAFDASNYPESNLTQEVIESLSYMDNEERLAYDIYTVLYNHHLGAGTEIKQLLNIPKSEQMHMDVVADVLEKYNLKDDSTDSEATTVGQYDIAAIQELYDALYTKGIVSKQAALEVGCMVEVVDVDDLDHAIQQAEDSNAADVVAAFNILRDGSYNHYWAFDKGLKRMGVTEGCGVLGEEWAKTPEEYPSSSNGH